MGNGSYRGGSTIAGRWSYDRDFPDNRVEERKSGLQGQPASKSKVLKAKAKRLVAEATRSQPALTRSAALILAGKPPLPTDLKLRQAMVKGLIREGFLLRSGVLNPHYDNSALSR